ncbi:transcriptional regulator [Alicyclobacillus cellulosilyticus]|uniref:Transcriptional regulator n=1 Tax=Alicyclobacillus cellulosilyticus TaxID=1003997 RepID=A0A917K1P6_9BACL|nr:metalloregulator ArsR/SmtB family transcription factor [Alicyclobacillus cellulosilyticus]GGI96468.1 transcriptional regulator [Alicyclobacillus cellulosilyticus]
MSGMLLTRNATEIHAKFFHGLANPTRLKMVELLLQGEKTVSQLVEETGASQSQVSNQLACLKWCGYVTSRQEGRFVWYKVSDERIRMLLELARAIVADHADRIRTCTRL